MRVARDKVFATRQSGLVEDYIFVFSERSLDPSLLSDQERWETFVSCLFQGLEIAVRQARHGIDVDLS